MKRSILLLFVISLHVNCLCAELAQDSVFRSLRKAFKTPNEVKVLDLRGQELDSIPVDIVQFKNLGVILLNSKLRNLLFYPKAWPYELRLKRLPAGGYAHLQGRGRGKFYLFNHIKILSDELLGFNKLELIDLRGLGIAGDPLVGKFKDHNPEIIILDYGLYEWDIFEKEYQRAVNLLKKYGFKY